jgi:putative NADPH-quinone reductase
LSPDPFAAGNAAPFLKRNLPMNIYAVFAYPSKQSFTRQVLDEFMRVLKEAGHSVETGDLYQMAFKAV